MRDHETIAVDVPIREVGEVQVDRLARGTTSAASPAAPPLWTISAPAMAPSFHRPSTARMSSPVGPLTLASIGSSTLMPPA